MKRPIPEQPRGRATQAHKAHPAHHSALHELFLDELADIYDAEERLTEALLEMAKAAESDDLREAIESHLEETEGHLSRIKQIAEDLGESLILNTCEAMKGLIKEGEKLVKEHKNSPALDAAIIAAAQKVEHYEIATYGTLCAWAEQLGLGQALKLLQETLYEERAADDKFTTVAESLANQKAEEVSG